MTKEKMINDVTTISNYKDEEILTVLELNDLGSKLSDVMMLIESTQLQLDLLSFRDNDANWRLHNYDRFGENQFHINQRILSYLDDIAIKLLNLKDVHKILSEENEIID